MKSIAGIIMIALGAAFGIYIGVWLCFIGGIVDVIQAIRSETLIAMDVAIGVAKVVFAGVFGWVSALILMVPGIAMLR